MHAYDQFDFFKIDLQNQYYLVIRILPVFADLKIMHRLDIHVFIHNKTTCEGLSVKGPVKTTRALHIYKLITNHAVCIAPTLLRRAILSIFYLFYNNWILYFWTREMPFHPNILLGMYTSRKKKKILFLKILGKDTVNNIHLRNFRYTKMIDYVISLKNQIM